MVAPLPKGNVLRYGAFLPAFILGTWLIVYTQRQAAKVPDDPPMPSGSIGNLTADTVRFDLNAGREASEFDDFIIFSKPLDPWIKTSPLAESPHVIRVTSKRIEMPIFNLRNVKLLLLADPGSQSRSGRKGLEQHVADLIDGAWRTAAPQSPPENSFSRDPFGE